MAHPGQSRVVAGDVLRSAVAACPDSTAWARVIRDTTANKLKPSTMRRLQRRGGQMPEAEPPSWRGIALRANSQSTGQWFAPKLRKTAVDAAPSTVRFSAYGLCLEGAVPQYPFRG